MSWPPLAKWGRMFCRDSGSVITRLDLINEILFDSATDLVTGLLWALTLWWSPSLESCSAMILMFCHCAAAAFPSSPSTTTTHTLTWPRIAVVCTGRT